MAYNVDRCHSPDMERPVRDETALPDERCGITHEEDWEKDDELTAAVYGEHIKAQSVCVDELTKCIRSSLEAMYHHGNADGLRHACGEKEEGMYRLMDELMRTFAWRNLP